MTYFEAVRAAMARLAQEPESVFLGQSVRYEANALFRTLPDVPMEKRIEMPVAEDLQMGVSIGLAMAGFLPVSIFPRWDFLLLAANQLVNHLDKWPTLPKVIIRTTVGARYPRDSGPQQTQDHTAAFRLMLRNVEVIELPSKWDVIRGYRRALDAKGSVLVVERQDLYND